MGIGILGVEFNNKNELIRNLDSILKINLHRDEPNRKKSI